MAAAGASHSARREGRGPRRATTRALSAGAGAAVIARATSSIVRSIDSSKCVIVLFKPSSLQAFKPSSLQAFKPSSLLISIRRASDTRHLTVPTGIPRSAAISGYEWAPDAARTKASRSFGDKCLISSCTRAAVSRETADRSGVGKSVGSASTGFVSSASAGGGVRRHHSARTRLRSRALRQAIVRSQVRNVASPRKPGNFCHATRKASCAASSASSDRPNAASAVRKTMRSCRVTSAPNASRSPALAADTSARSTGSSRPNGWTAPVESGSATRWATAAVTGDVDMSKAGTVG
jgi:hypothetical protein